jgi:uncharacterized membrane protein (DUF485 family)
MNPLLVSILKFTAVTLTAGAIGVFIVPSIGSFVVFSAVAAILQIVLGWVLDRYEQIRRARYEYEQRLDEEAILNANVVNVECAGCKTPHSIPIIATQRNLFRCRKCEGENVIIVSAETALTTTIPDTNA